MTIRETHTVPPQPEPIRLSDYAGGIFISLPARKGMKKAIDRGLVRVDGRPAVTATLLRGGETIALLADERLADQPALELRLAVRYEDEHLAVISKPAGITVSGNQWRTVTRALPFNLRPSPLPTALPRPQPAHRLDHPTSGLLLIGKTGTALTELGRLFATREILKTYHAVTAGPMAESDVFDAAIDGRPARTDYRLLTRVPSEEHTCLNLLRLHPRSGRRHQIRIHLATAGHPILGDREHGAGRVSRTGRGLYLHATELAFRHPATGEDLRISEELPAKFKKIFPE